MSTGLALSGGGAKGAFTVGAVDYLVNAKGMDFNVIAGTSTGALVAPLVVTGDIGVLKEVYTSVSTKDILTQLKASQLIPPKESTYLFSTKPLERLIRKHLTDQRADEILGSDRKTLLIAATCLQTGRVRYFYAGREPRVGAKFDISRVTSRAELRWAILASCNQPVIMPPVSVYKNDTRQFVDGGVREVTPLGVVVASGVESALAIILSPLDPPPLEVVYSSWVDILKRAVDVLTDDVLQNDIGTIQSTNQVLRSLGKLKNLLAAEAHLTPAEIDGFFTRAGVQDHGLSPTSITAIYPKDRLTDDALDFDRKKMAAWMELGYARAKELLP